jgi:hypothetical protein
VYRATLSLDGGLHFLTCVTDSNWPPRTADALRVVRTAPPPPLQLNVQLSVDTQQDPNILYADGGSDPLQYHSTFIRAIAKDNNGIPVAGARLTFTTDFGSFLDGSQNSASDTTDSSGKASVAYFNGVWILGSTDTKAATISVSGDGVRQANTVTVYNYRGFTFNDLTITDDEHNNSNDMTQAQVQQFFEQRRSFLARFILSTMSTEGFYDSNNNETWDVGEPLYEPDQSIRNGRFDGATATQRASQIFFDAAQARGINPKILIVTAEKEQSLISRAALPINGQYGELGTLDCAMGNGCGNPALRGFIQQVTGAADTFRRRFNDSSASRSFQGRVVAFPLFIMVTNDVTQNVRHRLHDQDQGNPRVPVSFWILVGNSHRATYAQFRYTPHVQAEPNGGGVYLFEKIWLQYQPLWPR